MKALTFAILTVAASGQAAVISGNWTLEKGYAPNQYQLNLSRADVIVDARRSLTVAETELKGLDGLASDPVGTPVHFELVRDAGTLRFEGMSRNGRAEGTFSFTENPAYVAALKNAVTNWWDSSAVFDLAIKGVPLSHVTAYNYQATVNLRVSDLSRAYSGETAPSYSKSVRDSGYLLQRPDIDRLRAQRVSPDLLRQLKVSGHDTLNTTDMLRLQTHGVTSQDIRFFETRTGKSNLTVDEIIKLKINGVQ